MKSAGFQIVKGFVSAVLLAYLLWRADLTALWTSFSFTDLRWLLVAFALHIPGYLISVARWQVLLLTQQIQVPSRVLLSSYLVGTFFNQLLPGTVGGDVVRVYDTARRVQPAARGQGGLGRGRQPDRREGIAASPGSLESGSCSAWGQAPWWVSRPSAETRPRRLFPVPAQGLRAIEADGSPANPGSAVKDCPFRGPLRGAGADRYPGQEAMPQGY